MLQEEIRRRNLGTLLRHVHLDGSVSRAALAERMGLNRSTIMALTLELTAAGLVREEAPTDTGRTGRPSLVGPRPLPADDGDFLGDVRRRLLVRPGMTGLWQVSGRSDLSWDEAVRLDLYYVDNWSLAYDLSILWRTVGVVLARKGAY